MKSKRANLKPVIPTPNSGARGEWLCCLSNRVVIFVARSSFQLLLLLLVSVCVQAQPINGSGSDGMISHITYYPIDQNAEFSRSLNGVWKFKLGPVDVAFARPDFDDRSWKPIQVPGNWELQGFEEPAYGKRPADTEGFYRRTFTVPAGWKNRRVFLRFEGVGFGFEFWLNGKRVGSFASSFNRSEFDITEFVTAGGSYTLAVRVNRRDKGWEFDTNDDWALSGIHRDVLMFSLPETHVKDYTVTTPVSSDQKQAAVKVKTWLEDFSGGTNQAILNIKVCNPDGVVVNSFSKTVEIQGHVSSVVESDLPISNPKLWTSETPALYHLDLDLEVNGKIVHQVSQRVGLRETTIDHGVFKLNGRSVKFRGVNHHDLHPATGRAMTREQYIEDLDLMKSANINAIRMSHYPPQKMFLDLCDEYGIYVIDEVPFGFGEEHLTDDSYEDILTLRARATVNRDKNQTCVLVWTVGNENPYTPMVLRTAALVKELDPSRSRCLAHPGGKYFFPLPPELDIVAPHYLTVLPHADQAGKQPLLQDVLNRPDCMAPVLMTEYAHAAGTAMEDLKSCWELMQNNDRFMGGCIWMFQDQGIYRKVPAGSYPGLPKTTDEAPVRLGQMQAKNWVAEDTVIDTCGQDGSDGIVDADRFPQSDYWAVRKIYAPVVIPIDSMPVKAGNQTLKIPIQNRYDFTDLDRVLGTWELRVDGQKTQGGAVTAKAAPRKQTTFDLSVSIPINPDAHDLFLRFKFSDATGRKLTEHTVRLLPSAGAKDTYLSSVESPSTNSVVREVAGQVVVCKAGKFYLQVNQKTGSLKYGVSGQPGCVFDGLALRVGRTPQMSELRAYRSMAHADFWFPYLLTNAVVEAVKISQLSAGQSQIELKLRFNRRTNLVAKMSRVSSQSIEADVQLGLSPQGTLDIDYSLSPQNATDYFLELGLALKLPASDQRLTWLGKGPYPVYPAQAEGMERGVYSIAPKAGFDPVNRMLGGNRTEVDLAAVTDEAGNGLGVVCQPATISVEPDGNTVFLSHLAAVAGHGEKRLISTVNLKADKIKLVSGKLSVLPLEAGQWPAVFKTVLANPETPPVWFQEFNPKQNASVAKKTSESRQ